MKLLAHALLALRLLSLALIQMILILILWQLLIQLLLQFLILMATLTLLLKLMLKLTLLRLLMAHPLAVMEEERSDSALSNSVLEDADGRSPTSSARLQFLHDRQSGPTPRTSGGVAVDSQLTVLANMERVRASLLHWDWRQLGLSHNGRSLQMA